MKATHNLQTSWLNKFLMSSLKTICMEVRNQEGGLINLEAGDVSSKAQSNGTMVKPSTNEDDSRRDYDIIIFGASSSVGKFLVEEMALVVDKYYSNKSQKQSPITSTQSIKEIRSPVQFAQNKRHSVPRHLDSIRWAVAGRSATKLSDTLCRAELSTGVKDLSVQVPVVLADLNHHRSLLDMCTKTSLLINCVGPYSLDGEVVVKACIESKTNYIDLTHETTFIDRIHQKYSQKARQAKIYIINGCGFQSMSAEMGLNFLKQVVDGQVNEVKIILNLSDSKAQIKASGSDTQAKSCGIVTYGMWQSFLVEKTQKMLQNDTESSKTTEHPAKKLLRKDTQSLVRDIVEYKNRNSFAWLQLIKGFEECGRRYCLPISGLTSDDTQLIRAEMSHYEVRKPDLDSNGWHPIRSTSFMSLKNLSEVVFMLIWLILFNIFVRFSLLRTLMKYFPFLSSLGHVNRNNNGFDRDSLSHIKFCQTFLAYGTPGDDSGDPLEKREKNLKRKSEQLLVTRVVGPEPNHVATATFSVQAALAIILEKDLMPIDFGVLTPGSAFSETNIIYQLRRRNIKFEVMRKA